MTLTGSNLIHEGVRLREIERRGIIKAIKIARKAGVAGWYIEDLERRAATLGDEIDNLKKDLKRLQGT